MIDFKVIFVILVLVKLGHQYARQDTCDLSPKFGMCRQLGIWYYYDGKMCRMFRGCPIRLNGNHFETKEDCMTMCDPSVPVDTVSCGPSPKFGLCRQLGIWYYFDGERCRKFRGCPTKLNANHFDSIEDCQQTGCERVVPEPY